MFINILIIIQHVYFSNRLGDVITAYMVICRRVLLDMMVTQLVNGEEVSLTLRTYKPLLFLLRK